jgi:EAL domain-containing protein (putative c-di-GMP-specific phosphodiesterase class I)/FixJ family two-component response regulator
MNNRIRVLLAEDDPSVRGALAAVIESEEDFEIVAAVADAAEATEAAARERPDVALVDFRMPGGGPLAARGILRGSPETRILALSASNDKATVLSMLEAGAVGYLVKDSAISTITDFIRRAAAGQGSLSAEVTGGVIGELAEQLNTQRLAARQHRKQAARISRALEEPNALQMFFQPIRFLQGQTVGVEALARFAGPPRRGPAEWFAEAERVALRDRLELRAAQKAIEALPQLPRDVFLALNLSPATLAMEELVALLGDTDSPRIVVELTEHAPVDDYECLNGALDRLRTLGVRLAVDDAGAGFASLRHILQLDPEFIKLDRTLVAGIQDDTRQQALAAGLISFADKIGSTIIAEGIETCGELEALQALGVRFGQGFHLGRPMPLTSPAEPGSREPSRPQSAAEGA